MIKGNFSDIGELIFEIDLIAVDEERYSVNVCFNTGLKNKSDRSFLKKSLHKLDIKKMAITPKSVVT